MKSPTKYNAINFLWIIPYMNSYKNTHIQFSENMYRKKINLLGKSKRHNDLSENLYGA
ncbi:hypothetical protein ATE84_5024 [Aquimarina sp. MAR_2010_214]|uniref:hypothetical protein n=1 Tax=Aquimarina sp. MAR_2010_214 TaxID=1250026 RepID=UPI000CBEA7B7|nr:hypothetical protein [Aquimarina sp. MAR_2010_214]PKV52893.1 hypothetical protein ATE84_5024 [Aquimarina sp. MAR_2010_214]